MYYFHMVCIYFNTNVKMCFQMPVGFCIFFFSFSHSHSLHIFSYLRFVFTRGK